MISESRTDLLGELNIDESIESLVLEQMASVDHRFLRDTRINMANALQSEHLSSRETALLAYAVAVNNGIPALIMAFEEKAREQGAGTEELAETAACASLLSANNVLYRFRHFMGKEKYDTIPARIKMNIMARPVIGKELFELISLAVSAVNGCEMCVRAHEASLIGMGMSEEKIFDAIRLASVVTATGKLFI